MSMKPITEDWGLAALEIDEAAPKHDDVLMVLSGPSFFRDIPSRNKRSYVGETWPKALNRPETKQMLENGLMFGTIGHLDVDMDTLVREKKVAIRTSTLNFDKKTGIGEGKYEVLDTELGRMVKKFYNTGSKFFVSTKAIGEYKGEDKDGNQKVDEDKFMLKRVDLVCDPGFLQAQPELKEQLEEAYHNDEPDTHIILECSKDLDKILQTVSKEDVQVENKELVEKVVAEKITLENELSTSNKDNELLESKLKNFGNVEEQNKILLERVEKAENEVKTFNTFFEEIGDMEKIKATLLKAKAFGEQVTDLGGVEVVTERLAQLDEFLALGDDPESMKTALEAALGVHESLLELVDVEEGVNPIDKIKEALEGSKQFIADTKKATLSEDVAEVSAKFGIEEDKVSEMVEAHGKEKAITIIEGVSGKAKVGVTDDIPKGGVVTESRSDRMFGGMGSKSE